MSTHDRALGDLVLLDVVEELGPVVVTAIGGVGVGTFVGGGVGPHIGVDAFVDVGTLNGFGGHAHHCAPPGLDPVTPAEPKAGENAPESSNPT